MQIKLKLLIKIIQKNLNTQLLWEC